jgi:hypothetical protein
MNLISIQHLKLMIKPSQEIVLLTQYIILFLPTFKSNAEEILSLQVFYNTNNIVGITETCSE